MLPGVFELSKQSLEIARTLLDNSKRNANTFQNRLIANLEVGVGVMSFSALIALIGLSSYCPRCGEWQGSGSEGKGPAAPKAKAPLPPKRLIKAMSEPMRPKTGQDASSGDRGSSKLTRGGILESSGSDISEPSKTRHQPQSQAHGRKTDTFSGGNPKPDSAPHAHSSDFIRGDGEVIPLYERQKDGQVVHESGVDVVIREGSGSYVWTPKIKGDQQ